MYRLKGLDLKENVSPLELNTRFMFRPAPNVIGFSLFYKKFKKGQKHISAVENYYTKAAGFRWAEWWADINDRRNISKYLYQRWYSN